MSTTKIPNELLSSGVGTSASNLVELDSSGKLPAVDGSAVTSLSSANLTGALPVLDGSNLTGLTPTPTKASIDALGISASSITGALPVISGANLTGVGVDGIVSTADGTAITIDSNENVLVGKTVAGFANTGHQLNGGGSYAAFTRDGGTPVLINRKTDDGTIVELMKDGTTVGSIGTAGSQSYIHGAGTDVGLFWGSNNVYPYRSTGLNDNTIDLGQSTKRFKDLYLSGGVRLGGTGTANALDDYEEGTWTPVLIDSSGTTITSTHANTRGRYEKIGRLVHIKLQIFGFATTGNGSLKFIEGLPYTSTNQMRSYARFASYAKPASSGVTDENFWVNAPSSKLSVWNSRDNTTYTDTTSIDANSEFFISISYSVS